MIYNFNPGPAMLPPEVLQQIQAELFNWRGTGISIMEISHRGSDFGVLIEEIERDCRDLLQLPDNYRILFMAGGARGQFAAIPLNLTAENQKAAYVITGLWGQTASQEAQRYAEIKIVASGEAQQFRAIPKQNTWKDFSGVAYLHYTDNETVQGVEFPETPETGDVPLVCDMSSSIFSRPIDVTRFGLIYAGAQKNLGIAGITLVIIRDDLLERTAQKITPAIFNYAVQAKSKSLYNTPAVFPWYVCGLMFKWLKKQGGLTAIGERNRRKSEKLYRCIDESGFYKNNVEPGSRSRMNVIFSLPDSEKEKKFLEAAKAEGLIGLKGHSTLGGMRASLYNALPETAVDALIIFMQNFAAHS